MEWEQTYKAVTWLRKNWAKLRPWVTPVALAKGKPIPKETFRIVLDNSVPPSWCIGSMRGSPATQIHARYYVTNITDEKMLIAGAKLKPEGMDQAYSLQHTAEKMRDGEETTPTNIVSVHGFVVPPITVDGETLHSQIIFIDQFGNENVGPVTIFSQKGSQLGRK